MFGKRDRMGQAAEIVAGKGWSEQCVIFQQDAGEPLEAIV
jgi:hypothetical protein